MGRSRWRRAEARENEGGENCGASIVVWTGLCGLLVYLVVDDLCLLEQDTLIRVNEPLHGLLAGNTLVLSDDSDGSAAVLDTGTGASENDVDIHTEDTDGGIVLDTEIDVLLDTETEVSSVGEVTLEQLVLLNLQSLLEDLLSLGAADGRVDGNLLVTADTEGTHGVAGLGVDGGLSSELIQNYAHTTIIFGPPDVPIAHAQQQQQPQKLFKNKEKVPVSFSVTLSHVFIFHFMVHDPLNVDVPLLAQVRRSPDSPTPMLMTNFSMVILRIGLASCFSFLAEGAVVAAYIFKTATKQLG